MDVVVKLRLGALIPRSVGLSVGQSVRPSVRQKLQKNYKTLQNINKCYIMLQNIEIKRLCTPPPPAPPLPLNL